MSDRRAQGKQGEDRAATYLTAGGYTIIERNFTSRYGEIDLVCRDGDTLVFVEVKTRRPSGFGTAAEAVSRPKQRRLISAAQDYLQKTGDSHSSVRFDVVTIEGGRDGSPSITLIKNAIEFE